MCQLFWSEALMVLAARVLADMTGTKDHMQEMPNGKLIVV